MKTILIDPGHGGSDPGASFSGKQEKGYTLAVSKLVRDLLQKNYEVNVRMTRDNDATLSLKQRTDFANSTNVDFYFSIHINAGGGTGFESFIYNGSVPSQTVAHQSAIHQEIMRAIQGKYSITDRGKKKADFHVLRETKMSAVLIELLFIDNKKDLELLNNPAFIADAAAGIAKGVAKALDLPSKPISSQLYRVIAGSFAKKENAEDQVQFLQSKGYEAFVDSTVVLGKDFFRVQAGSFSSRENAEKRVAELGKFAIQAFILSANELEPAPPAPAPPPTPIPTPEPYPNPPAPPSPEQPVPRSRTIQGSSIMKAEQLNAFVKTVNPDAPELGEFYLKYGEVYGVRGDMAFAQAIHETNYFRFTGTVKKEQNNFAGLGATSSTVSGATFTTPEEGVHAHIQHLYAYSTKEPVPEGYSIVDPRFTFVKRGSAVTWTDLNGKWAVPGTTYGQMITVIYKKMLLHTLKDLVKQQTILEIELMKE